MELNSARDGYIFHQINRIMVRVKRAIRFHHARDLDSGFDIGKFISTQRQREHSVLPIRASTECVIWSI